MDVQSPLIAASSGLLAHSEECHWLCSGLLSEGFSTDLVSFSHWERILGARLRVRATTHASTKGTEKVLGRALGKDSGQGF